MAQKVICPLIILIMALPATIGCEGGMPIVPKVSISIPAGATPIATQATVCIRLQNDFASDWLLSMNPWGFPNDLIVSVINPKGEKLPLRPLSVSVGPPTPMRADEKYRLEKGKALSIKLHLYKLVEMSLPGIYSVSVEWLGNRDQVAVTVGNCKVVQETSLPKTVVLPLPSTVGTATEFAFASKLSVVDVNQNTLIDRFLLLTGSHGSLNQGNALINAQRLKNNDRIAKADIDLYGQVWIVIQDGSMESLLIWNVTRTTFQVILPPANRSIQLDSASSWNYRDRGRIVFARTSDGSEFNSLNLTE